MSDVYGTFLDLEIKLIGKSIEKPKHLKFVISQPKYCENKPPIHQDNPRFSTSTSHRAAELAAVALVNESPTWHE